MINRFCENIFTKKVNAEKQKLPPSDAPTEGAIKVDFSEGSEFMLKTKTGRDIRQKAVIETKEKFKRIFEEKQKSDIEKRKIELYELKEKLKSIYSQIEEALKTPKS